MQNPFVIPTAEGFAIIDKDSISAVMNLKDGSTEIDILGSSGQVWSITTTWSVLQVYQAMARKLRVCPETGRDERVNH